MQTKTTTNYNVQLTPNRNKYRHSSHNKLIFNNTNSPQSYPNSHQDLKNIKLNAKVSNSYSKTAQNFHYHRNKRSLKILNIHLKQYKQKIQDSVGKNVNDNLQIVLQHTVEKQKDLSNYGKSSILFKNHGHKNNQNINKQEMQVSSSLTDKQTSNQLFNSTFQTTSSPSTPIQVFQPFSRAQPKAQSFQQKCQSVIDSLLLNINIFKKVFSNTKKKRSLISKLYGWDPMFLNIFFTQYSQNNYSEQFKPNITKQYIMHELGFQKKNFNTQNIYNKLRLFLAQLSNANIKHQQLESNNQKNKLLVSSHKLRNSLQRLNHESLPKQSTLRQIDIIKQTHVDMIRMKMRIKNKGNDIQKLSQGLNGGDGVSGINLHPFYLKQEKNIAEIQTFIDGIMKNQKLKA